MKLQYIFNNHKDNMNKKGFSLLEIIITIFIIGFAFVGVIRAYNYALKHFVRAKECNTANLLLRREFELIKLKFKHDESYTPVSEINQKVKDVVNGNILPEYAKWKYSLTVEDNDIFPNGQVLNGRLKKITITFYSPVGNIFSGVTYITPGGNNN